MNNLNYLNKFSNGASYLLDENAYERFVKRKKKLGRQNGKNGYLFVRTKDDVDNAIRNSNGDISKIERALGLEDGQLGDGSVNRVDIINPEKHNLRIADGTEFGAKSSKIHYLREKTDFGNMRVVCDEEGRPVIDVEKTNPNN